MPTQGRGHGTRRTCPTFSRRIAVVMNAECGKDSAGDAARKGFRAERVGFVWSERVLEVLAPGFGPEGVGLQFSKSGEGSFQQSALSRQSDKGENIGGAPQRARRAERRRIAVALDVGFVWRGGAVKVAAGRRPASSRRLRRALTCPTCFRIHLEAHAHAKPWAWHPADLPYLLGGGLTSS